MRSRCAAPPRPGVHRLRRQRHRARRDGPAARHAPDLARDRRAGRRRRGRGAGGPPAARRHPLDGRRDRRTRRRRCARLRSMTPTARSLAAAVARAGRRAGPARHRPDEEAALDAGGRRGAAPATWSSCPGGTSKGAGDLSYRRRRAAARARHRRARGGAEARQAGLPRGHAAASRSSILPGFPTSAIFTFHEFVAPVIRRLAGLPPRAGETVRDRCRSASTSERGRTEYVMVSLVRGAGRARAYPMGKGSGSVTAFSPGRRLRHNRRASGDTSRPGARSRSR